jgi:signal transduction histidine kinase
VIRPLRRSFAAKLIAGGCVLALVVVGGVAGYLIFSRAAQTRGGAQSNADNRAGVMVQVLDRFTGAQALSSAASLADQPALHTALAAPDPAAAVSSLFTGGASVDLAGEVLLVTDSSARLIYNHPSASVATNVSILTAPQSVRTALNGGRCSASDSTAVSGGCGVELLSDGEAAYVVALPVLNAGTVVGAVAYVAPLTFQLDRFQALFGFPTAFVPSQRTDLELRPTGGGTTATDPALRSALARSAKTYQAIYNAPTASGATETVAGSFLPVYGPNHELTGYLGVEVPLSQFVGAEGTDILVVALISVFVLLLVTIAVVVFVERFVKRPIARLETGVARIAGGDYATGITVRSQDELGRLAANVNRMRDSIAGYVRQIEEGQERLNSALEQVSGVSRALTTTTAGVPTLQQAVVRTAAVIGGEAASSVLALREGDSLTAATTEGSPPPLADWPGLDAVLGGETVRIEHADHGVLVAVPMFYQDNVVGALAVVTPHRAGEPAPDTDVDVLAVLANNAAIAMENARLFEQEKETVRRLLELDSLKTDFLSTVQHELRTPLTAILGLSDLLDMCWGMWEEEPKLEAVRDIQVAAKNLYDIVETIIDYSAMEDDKLGLHPTLVPLKATVASTLELVGERYKGGLPVPVDVEGDDDVSVFADPDRLTQVLRAITDNAMKFSDGKGRVRFSFTAVSHGREVRIEIADEGVGIPADDLPRIFDRFYQVDNTATRKYGGTGMGLALVKRMVQAHGARVEVESTVGEGTRVILLWPASQAAAAGEARAVVDERGDGGATPRRASRRRAVPVQ